MIHPRDVHELIAQGKEHEARKVARRYSHIPDQDLETYWQWGELCRDLALAKEALKCYDLALAQDPHNPLVLYSKAQLLYDIGHLSRARRLVTKLLGLYPSHEEGRELLAAIYREMGAKGAMKALQKSPEEPSPLRYFPPSLGSREIELFLSLFSGRPYKALIYLEPPLAQLKTRFVKGAITPDEARAHLLGETYLAFFPLRDDLTASQGVLKIAPTQKDIEEHIRDRAWTSEKSQAAQYLALKAYKTAQSHGLPCALERFHTLEYRLWFFFDTPIHFLWAKRFLEAFIQKIPYPQMGITYKPLLPTRGEGLGWREQWLELPLGIHPFTLERSLFIDEEGQPFLQQFHFLKTVGRLPSENIKGLCIKMDVDLTVSQVKEEDVSLKKLILRCPLIEYLVNKARAGRLLSKREKQALFLTLGKVGDGSLVHKVLITCPDYNRAKIENMLKNQPPYPVSCFKLREWFPEVLPEHLCHCQFANQEHYPTPILHIVPGLSTYTFLYTSLKEASPKRLLKEYASLLQEEKRLKERKEILEDELKERLKEQRTIVSQGLRAYLKGDKLVVEDSS